MLYGILPTSDLLQEIGAWGLIFPGAQVPKISRVRMEGISYHLKFWEVA